MAIDPGAATGGDVDPTIVPFAVDHTPQPGTDTSITGLDSSLGLGAADDDRTLAPAPVQPRRTAAPVTADPDRTIAPSAVDPDQTIAPGAVDLDQTIAPSAVDPDQTIAPSSREAERTRAPGPGGVDHTFAPAIADGGLTLPPGGGPPESGAELPPGTKLGSRYTILKLLGRGGMGAVYQAYDDELGVAVAIKTILTGEGSDEYTRRDQVSRFKSELLLARQVTHKNVVRIHDLGEFRGLKYITMSYVAGETLTALVRRVGPLPVPQAMALARQIADGMAAAHDVGVVHRDLKPDNVMVTPDGQALIMDFGIASSSESAKGGGQVVGTISYMAPEQATGKSVDARADLYAYGLICYDMLVGFQRLKRYEKPLDELRARFAAAPAELRTLRAEVPAALESLVARATQPAPEARFADVLELRDALSNLTDDGQPQAGREAAGPLAGGGRQRAGHGHRRIERVVVFHPAGDCRNGAGVGARRRLREQDRRPRVQRRRRTGARARHRERVVRHPVPPARRAARGGRAQARRHPRRTDGATGGLAGRGGPGAGRQRRAVRLAVPHHARGCWPAATRRRRRRRR